MVALTLYSLQPVVSNVLRVLRMDRVDTDTLMGYAEARSREIAPRFKDMFLDHTASPYRPYHPQPQEQTAWPS